MFPRPEFHPIIFEEICLRDDADPIVLNITYLSLPEYRIIRQKL